VEELVFGRRYRATEKIGTGGMADVFKAVDETLGRTVAVKVMHARYAADPAFAARFRQEAQAAANLVSPNIVNMYDWGQDGDTYYIVMEYVRGTDLKSIIEQKGAIPSRKVADVGAQVCSALSVAHGYDIIHRDIKPHNIMVQPDGSVKVMDFGIARAGNSTMTQTGSVLGTAHYVSPEQAQGKPLTATSDLYSLGVVLYESATGKLPFDADTPVAVALKQVNEMPRPASAVNPNIDPGLEAVIMKALSKRPTDRYPSADEMRKDLVRVAQGLPVGAAAVGAGAAMAAGAGHMDETAVMPAVGGQSGYGEPARRPAPKKKPVWPWIVLAVILVIAGLGIASAMGLLGVRTAPVPDVSGRTRAEATKLLTEAGFVVGTVNEVFSDNVDVGLVTKQTPKASEEARKGTAVDLDISKGADVAIVPSVIGMTETDAFKLLTEAGFSPQPLAQEFNKDIEAGKVFKQEPAAGQKLKKGTVVNYVVSRGAELVLVPSVTGKSQSQAIKALKDAGFGVSTKTENSDTTKKGVVMSQNPTGGSVPKGSTVTITVSSGPASVAVPDTIGSSEADARTKLEAAGLKVNVVYELHANTGLVFDQSPKKGQQVTLGSTVLIKVDSAAP
jgi:eukaryotic-like serine/threonine-protein kinase